MNLIILQENLHKIPLLDPHLEGVTYIQILTGTLTKWIVSQSWQVQLYINIINFKIMIYFFYCVIYTNVLRFYFVYNYCKYYTHRVTGSSYFNVSI